MVVILCFLTILVSFTNAQVLLSEDFSNYFFSSSNTGVLALYNANDTLITDVVGSNNMTVAVASSGKDQINNLILNGYSEHINNDGHYTVSEPTDLDVTGSFTVNVAIWFDLLNANEVIFSKNDNSVTQVQYFANYWNSNSAFRFGYYDGSNVYRVSQTGLSDSTWYVLTFVYDSSAQTQSIYLNGTIHNGVQIGTVSSQLTDYAHDFRFSGYTTTNSRLKARVAAFRFSEGVASSVEISEAGFLPATWKSLNGGVTRKNWEFSQGVVSDTIYYASVLTSGNWSITLSDSAASSVNYEVLTSADATTWTTLASGTTGTSWGSKSYSGTGSGYIAVSVASGTAFFDDLIVTRGNNNKFKYNKHSIHSTYLK